MSVLHLLTLFLTALATNYFVNRESLNEQPTYTTALVFLWLVTASPGGGLGYASAGAVLFFVLSYLSLFRGLQLTREGRDAILLAGFYLGLAALGYYPVLLVLPAYLLAIWRMRAAPLRETLMLALGVVMPAYLLWSGFFLLDREGLFYQAFPPLEVDTRFAAPPALWAWVGLCILVVLSGLIGFSRSGLLKEIRYRRYFEILLTTLISMGLMAWLAPGDAWAVLPLVAAPAAWMGGVYFSEQKLGRRHRLLFAFVVVGWLAMKAWYGRALMGF
jgi:hypothetical protein